MACFNGVDGDRHRVLLLRVPASNQSTNDTQSPNACDLLMTHISQLHAIQEWFRLGYQVIWEGLTTLCELEA